MCMISVVKSAHSETRSEADVASCTSKFPTRSVLGICMTSRENNVGFVV
jgi:hypothetical protein